MADGGYVGEPFAQDVRETLGEQVTVQIAKRNELHTFKVMPQRWVVERSFAWLEKNRRLWKNCERLLNTSLQFIWSSSPRESHPQALTQPDMNLSSKDELRRGCYPVIHFDFLGYRFQPRCAQRRGGTLFLSFLPAVSVKAAKAMRETIRSWKTHRWTQLSIKELADSFNPVLRGWINYYGKFYKSRLAPILGHLDYALVRWAKRKYKRLGSTSRATAWLKRVVAQSPRLFAHWAITHAGLAG